MKPDLEIWLFIESCKMEKMERSKFVDKLIFKLKLIFNWKKENSPTKKVISKTKEGNPISISGDGNSIQQADTIHNHFSSKSDSSEQNLINNLLNEIEYNISPGVGCPKCLFEFIYHNELLNSKIRPDLHDSFRELIKHMKLCNAYGTIRRLKHPPGSVKTQSKILKAHLKDKVTFTKED